MLFDKWIINLGEISNKVELYKSRQLYFKILFKCSLEVNPDLLEPGSSWVEAHKFSLVRLISKKPDDISFFEVVNL